MTSQQTLHHQRKHIHKVVLDFLALCVVICPSHRLCVTVFVSDWAAAGLCPRPDEASASPADREEPQRPHRPGELPSTSCPTIYPCYQTNSQQHSVIDGSCLWGLVENDEAALKHKRVWAVLVGWRSLPVHLRPCLISIDLSVLTSISYSHWRDWTKSSAFAEIVEPLFSGDHWLCGSYSDFFFLYISLYF